MATSKFPLDFFDVPPSLADLTKSHEIYCNFRPDRREDLKEIVSSGDSQKILKLQICAYFDGFWSEPINEYLKSVTKETRVVMLLQGFKPSQLCTVTVLLPPVYWTNEDYPRLDFIRPEALKKIIGESNVWGAFVIAIAPVNSQAKIFGEIVIDENLFLDIVRKNGFIKKGNKKKKNVILNPPAFL